MDRRGFSNAELLLFMFFCVAILYGGALTLLVRENSTAVTEKTRLQVQQHEENAELKRQENAQLKRIADIQERIWPATKTPKRSSN